MNWSYISQGPTYTCGNGLEYLTLKQHSPEQIKEFGEKKMHPTDHEWNITHPTWSEKEDNPIISWAPQSLDTLEQLYKSHRAPGHQGLYSKSHCSLGIKVIDKVIGM